ncbi:hypothetical protein ACEPPN_017874 [Leptodophora sp. 'Broadleaf-Isolate-01']
MHLTSSIIGLFLATSRLAAALPQPGLNVQITVQDDVLNTEKATNGNFAKDLRFSDDNVHYVQSNAEYDTLMQIPGRLIVVDFKANWYGPCRAVAPFFSQYSNDYSQAVFIVVDIEKLPDHPEVKEIRSVPTFKFRKNGSLLTEFAGASAQKLKDTIVANL